MDQKKRFILEIPYFLATKAGSLYIRITYAFCYFILILGYHFIPPLGCFLAFAVCLLVWQVLNILVKHDKKYRIYNSFLLQRLAFCVLVVIAIFMYSVKDGVLDINIWRICVLVLSLINLGDLILSLKGTIGFGYIKFGDDN